ncbi:DUF1697 domain-containing protein [Arthrobacter sp. KK5.5]|uniref:DUF1697 domain-containing protein n=1 Tax=Arthrobacter sp. KK5.5 TaxID=3373084 RepID=UPI003EE7F40F
MPTYAVFLRGVNVGGIRIAMPDLRRVLTDAGFHNVSTLRATGNVVLDASMPDASTVKKDVEAALRTGLDYDAWVIVKTPGQVAEIVDGYPFTAPDDGVARHAYAILTTSAETVREAVAACPEPSPEERFKGVGDVLYWEVPRGNTLDSKLARQLGRVRYKPLATTRNLNTMRKVLARCEPAGS